MATQNPLKYSSLGELVGGMQAEQQDALRLAQERRRQLLAEYEAALQEQQAAQEASIAQMPAATTAPAPTATADTAQPAALPTLVDKVRQSKFAKEFLPTQKTVEGKPMDVGQFYALPFEQREKITRLFIDARAKERGWDKAQKDAALKELDTIVYADEGGEAPSVVGRAVGDIWDRAAASLRGNVKGAAAAAADNLGADEFANYVRDSEKAAQQEDMGRYGAATKDVLRRRALREREEAANPEGTAWYDRAGGWLGDLARAPGAVAGEVIGGALPALVAAVLTRGNSLMTQLGTTTAVAGVPGALNVNEASYQAGRKSGMSHEQARAAANQPGAVALQVASGAVEAFGGLKGLEGLLRAGAGGALRRGVTATGVEALEGAAASAPAQMSENIATGRPKLENVVAATAEGALQEAVGGAMLSPAVNLMAPTLPGEQNATQGGSPQQAGQQQRAGVDAQVQADGQDGGVPPVDAGTGPQTGGGDSVGQEAEVAEGVTPDDVEMVLTSVAREVPVPEMFDTPSQVMAFLDKGKTPQPTLDNIETTLSSLFARPQPVTAKELQDMGAVLTPGTVIEQVMAPAQRAHDPQRVREAYDAAVAEAQTNRTETPAAQSQFEANPLARRDYSGVPDTPVSPALTQALLAPEGVASTSAVEHLARTASTRDQRMMASFLLDKLKRSEFMLGSPISIFSQENLTVTDKDGNPQRASGVFQVSADATRARIILDRESGLAEEVLLHEVVHAATEAHMIASPDKLSPLQKAARQDIYALHQFALDQGLLKTFEIPTASEFASEAITNPRLKAVMKATPYTQKLSVWGKFKESLRGLLGMDKMKVPDNLLEATLTAVDALTVSGARFEATTAAAARQRLPDTIDVDGQQRPTTNSDGRPIHPTEEGVRNFWRWFGDSKVVDEQGRPLVVYHGTVPSKAGMLKATKQGISQFDTGGAGKTKGAGAFFTSSPDVANTYAGRSQGAAVYPVYLKLSNPVELDVAGGNWGNLLGAKVKLGGVETALPLTTLFGRDAGHTDGLGRAAKKSGYDSVIINNIVDIGPRDVPDGTGESTVFIVQDPTQIKSATGNTGAFSPDNGSINAARQRREAPPLPPEMERQKLLDQQVKESTDAAKADMVDFLQARFSNDPKDYHRGSAFYDRTAKVWRAKFLWDDGRVYENQAPLRSLREAEEFLNRFRPLDENGQPVADARAVIVKEGKNTGHVANFEAVNTVLDALRPGSRALYDKAVELGISKDVAHAIAKWTDGFTRWNFSRLSALDAVKSHTGSLRENALIRRAKLANQTKVGGFNGERTMKTLLDNLYGSVDAAQKASPGVTADMTDMYMYAASAAQGNAIKAKNMPTDAFGRPRIGGKDFSKFSYYEAPNGSITTKGAPGARHVTGADAAIKYNAQFTKQFPEAAKVLTTALDHLREANKAAIAIQLENGAIGPQEAADLLAQDLYLPMQQIGKRTSGVVRGTIGRSTMATSPLAQLKGVLDARINYAAYKGAIQELAMALQHNPNPAIGDLNSYDVKVSTSPKVDEDTGEVDAKKLISADWIGERSVKVWVGDRQLKLTINDDNLLKAIKPTKHGDVPMAIVGAMAATTQAFSTMLTATPRFILQAAGWDLVQINATMQAAYKHEAAAAAYKQVLGTYKRMVPALGDAVRSVLRRDAKDPMRRFYDVNGGGIVFGAKNVMRDALLDAGKGSAADYVQRGAGAVLNAISAPGHVISDAVRFASFKAFMESKHGGPFKSEAELAMFADAHPDVVKQAVMGSKILLGNYEDVGQQLLLRSVVPFYNAASVGVGQNLYNTATTRQGQITMGVIATTAMITALAAMGGDDEDEDGFGKFLRKDSSWTGLNIGDTVVPLPHEMRLALMAGYWAAAGVNETMGRNKPQDYENMTRRSMNTVAQGAFLPIPGIEVGDKEFFATLGPLGTLAMLAKTENDAFGRPRVSQQAEKKFKAELQPYYMNPRASDTADAVEVSKLLFEVTGHNISPSAADIWIGQFAGGWNGLRTALEKSRAEGRSDTDGFSEWVMGGYNQSEDNLFASTRRWDAERAEHMSAPEFRKQQFIEHNKAVKKATDGIGSLYTQMGQARRDGNVEVYRQLQEQIKQQGGAADKLRRDWYKATGNQNRNLLEQ